MSLAQSAALADRDTQRLAEIGRLHEHITDLEAEIVQLTQRNAILRAQAAHPNIPATRCPGCGHPAHHTTCLHRGGGGVPGFPSTQHVCRCTATAVVTADPGCEK